MRAWQLPPIYYSVLQFYFYKHNMSSPNKSTENRGRWARKRQGGSPNNKSPSFRPKKHANTSSGEPQSAFTLTIKPPPAAVHCIPKRVSPKKAASPHQSACVEFSNLYAVLYIEEDHSEDLGDSSAAHVKLFVATDLGECDIKAPTVSYEAKSEQPVAASQSQVSETKTLCDPKIEKRVYDMRALQALQPVRTPELPHDVRQKLFKLGILAGAQTSSSQDVRRSPTYVAPHKRSGFRKPSPASTSNNWRERPSTAPTAMGSRSCRFDFNWSSPHSAPGIQATVF